jgi:cytochrome c oxidase assembly factor CtaG
MIGRVTILILASTAPAAAHGNATDAFGLATTWTYDPWVVAPLYASAGLYLLGTGRLWRRAGFARGIRRWQVVCFWSGWTLLALALLSPLHWLGERLFAAHMAEHEILMVVAAPLLAAARPIGAFIWALPRGWASILGKAARYRPVAACWRMLRDPFVATVVHAVALWAWHVPAIFEAALTDVAIHRMQHVSFFLSALMFWWALFYGPSRQRGYGIAVGCLFFTTMHSALLGILLTLSRRPWYPGQSPFAEICGLTQMQDQQLGGLVMWVPPGLVYLILALYFAGTWIVTAGAGGSRGVRRVIAAR